MPNALVTRRAVISSKKRRMFLRVLRDTGVVMHAVKAVGYTNASYLQRYKKENEDFAEEWDEAIEAGCDLLEEELWRRAVTGVDEPIMYKGEVVGFIRKFSDTLLQTALKAGRPDKYREGARGGDMNINVGIAVVPSTAKGDAAWEQRALNMHDNQVPIVLEAKPVENQLTRVNRIKRGD